MMETEVTQELYLAVMGKNPSYFTGDLQRPVENVSWEDGIRFANALSTAMGLEPAYDGDDNNAGFIEGSNGFRYPLVVEWSWAALCGEERQHRYIGSDNRNAVAWWSGNSEGQTHPVGQKQANACGLRDMSGNVMEWVADDSENLGQHRSGAATRYIIGNSGGFLGTSDNCIYQNRNEISPWLTCKDVGLRLVRALD
jgi:formylglycine-generating enzyme required for sulfatase activity